mgnify:CR=1 FL=1
MLCQRKRFNASDQREQGDINFIVSSIFGCNPLSFTRSFYVDNSRGEMRNVIWNVSRQLNIEFLISALQSERFQGGLLKYKRFLSADGFYFYVFNCATFNVDIIYNVHVQIQIFYYYVISYYSSSTNFTFNYIISYIYQIMHYIT